MSVAKYEFRVSGRMSERTRHAVDDFGAMQVMSAPPETIIYGTVTDEAHLHGILGLLDNLGLHLVSVQRISGPPTDDPGS